PRSLPLGGTGGQRERDKCQSNRNFVAALHGRAGRTRIMRKKDRPRALGSRLAMRDMRLRAGLTEQALAARLGVTHHTIETWEMEKGRPVRQKWLFKLAEALGCSVAELRQA